MASLGGHRQGRGIVGKLVMMMVKMGEGDAMMKIRDYGWGPHGGKCVRSDGSAIANEDPVG